MAKTIDTVYIANNNLNGDTVMKTLYETLGGTYRNENGRLIPEMKLPEQTNIKLASTGSFILTILRITVAEDIPLC